MFNSLKKILISDLLKSISIYTFFRLINRSLPILLLPFLTHYLSPQDYSIIDIFTNIGYIVLPIIGLNAYSSASRFYYEKDIDYKVFLSTVINFTLISFVFISLLSLLINTYIFSFIKIEKINYFLFTIVVFSLLEQIVLIHTTNLRLEDKTIEYGFIGLFRTIIELLATILIILYFVADWRGRIIGQAFGLVFFALYSFYKLYHNGYISIKYSNLFLKESLVFGFPLIIHTIAGIFLGFSNRFFIIKYLGLHDAGIFASAYQIGMAISLLHTSFNEAWVPYLFKTLSYNDNYNTRKNLVKISYLYFLLLIILTIVFILFVPLIYKIIGKNFYISYNNIIIIAFAFLFNGFYKMLVNYLFYTKKTYYIAIGTIFVLAISIFFNYIFIIKFGLLGASIALFLTFFTHFIIFLILTNMTFKLPWLYFFKTLKFNKYEKNN